MQNCVKFLNYEPHGEPNGLPTVKLYGVNYTKLRKQYFKLASSGKYGWDKMKKLAHPNNQV